MFKRKTNTHNNQEIHTKCYACCVPVLTQHIRRSGIVVNKQLDELITFNTQYDKKYGDLKLRRPQISKLN